MKNAMRSLLCFLLLCLFLPTVAFAIEKDCPSKNYMDIPNEAAWSHKGIDFVISNGLMTGTEKNVFSPNEAVTREMLATILYRMSESPDITYHRAFQDVPKGAWYTKAVIWCNTHNIIKGYGDGFFGVGDKLTREQMAVMLERYTKLIRSRNTSAKTNLDRFADTDFISDWALDSMKWAVACNLIQGTGNDCLSPQETATRAQLATILMRYDVIFDPSLDSYVSRTADGSLFSLTTDQIEAITILDPNGKMVEITDPKEVKTIINQLNAYRFHFAVPEIQTGMSSSQYRLLLSGPAGEEGYSLYSGALEVDDVIYMGNPLYFANLIRLVNES